MTGSERRNAIVEVLLSRSSEKIENLAHEFAVTPRTIRRDIDELSLSYPVYTERGRHKGGVYIDQSYRMKRKFFRSEEEDLLKRLVLRLDGNDLEIIQGLLSKFT